jgi:hypothetical protein
MRIEPQLPQDKYKDLSLLQNRSRKAAIVVAFCGVFVWVIKILFL